MSNIKNQSPSRIVDKNFCLSSFMAFRYIYKDNTDFFPSLHHLVPKPIPKSKIVGVKTSDDIDHAIQKQIDKLYEKYDKIGVLLSGGMDSATVAAYLKPGSNAYTFDTKLSDVYDLDRGRAQKYCDALGLKLNLVDISFDDYKEYSPILMKHRGAPVHSIEPQMYKAMLAARANGDEVMVTGEGADDAFGGMDQLLSKDWTFDEFVKRYTFLDPELVLTHPVDMTPLFEKYREKGGGIDYREFLEDVFSAESSGSFINIAETARTPKYYAPYLYVAMSEPLNLNRIRGGESKYLVRELFAKKYPGLEVPDKHPMPRPVDTIFADWTGPTRPEFRKDIPMNKLSGNQKWQLWCAEQFLNLFDPQFKS